MKIKICGFTRKTGAWMSRAFCVLIAAGLVALAARTAEAKSERYDPQQAANPIRIAAYILHPVGVLLDYGLFRPCFWVVEREPFSTIFGYEHPRSEDLPEKN